MSTIYDELTRMQSDGQVGVLVVVTHVDGHTPQVQGAKMIVRGDGSLVGTIGGGRVEHVVIHRALEVLGDGRPARASFNLKAELGMCCGGKMEVYMEPIAPLARLLVFGAGHVAEATVRLATTCGFSATVIDEREDWNTEDRFPSAGSRHVEPHGDFLSRSELGRGDHVLILTHNHDYDREILGRCLASEAGYVGMIGSTRKVEKTLKQLRLEGLDEPSLARAHAPVGLDILAETPGELAVSIVGELIRHRRAASSRKKTHGAPVELLSQGEGDGSGPKLSLGQKGELHE